MLDIKSLNLQYITDEAGEKTAVVLAKDSYRGI